MLLFNPFWFLAGFTSLRRDKKYMSPEQLGQHYGPEAQREAEEREREREQRSKVDAHNH